MGGNAGCEGTGGALGGGGISAWLGGLGGLGGVSIPSTGSASGRSGWPPSKTISKLGGAAGGRGLVRGSGQKMSSAAINTCAAIEPSQKAGKPKSGGLGVGGRQRERGGAGRQFGPCGSRRIAKRRRAPKRARGLSFGGVGFARVTRFCRTWGGA